MMERLTEQNQPIIRPMMTGIIREERIYLNDLHSLYLNAEAAEHAKRVGDLARQFAHYLNLDEQTQARWQVGGYLHDIGKRLIPDAILSKQTKLSDDEYDLMKQHVVKAYDLHDLTQVDLTIHAMILEHHERWDGTGYPYGLKGADIHVGGRVMAILDVYDAMTQRRCYQEARSQEDVLTYLAEQQGRLFDPYYVQAFIQFINASFKRESRVS